MNIYIIIYIYYSLIVQLVCFTEVLQTIKRKYSAYAIYQLTRNIFFTFLQDMLEFELNYSIQRKILVIFYTICMYIILFIYIYIYIYMNFCPSVYL